MFEEATLTRAETVKECKRLTAAIRKTDSEKLKRDYNKHLKKLWKRLLYSTED